MPTFVARIAEALDKGEKLGEFATESPFLFDCAMDHFARWEDIPLARRKNPRAREVRRSLAFQLGRKQIHGKGKSCPWLGGE